MAKGACPVCEELQYITTTDEAVSYRTNPDFSRVPVGSSRYWKVDVHPRQAGAPDDTNGWPICEGSGRRI